MQKPMTVNGTKVPKDETAHALESKSSACRSEQTTNNKDNFYGRRVFGLRAFKRNCCFSRLSLMNVAIPASNLIAGDQPQREPSPILEDIRITTR
jgi:hypothetical protein